MPTNREIRQRQWEEVSQAFKTDLGILCREALGMKDWGIVHDELADFLRTSGRRKHIELARGHLKSSIVTKGWSIQQVLNNPDVRILLANAVWDNSRKFLRSIQKYVGQGSILETVFGSFQSQHWNQDECTVKARKAILDAPTWATTGIEKEQTSQHYDIIIADDLVARENVMTPEQREKVYLYYKDLLDLLEPDGTIVVIGTRWHQDDLYAKIIEENDEAKKSGALRPWDLFIRTCWREDGTPTFPEKFSRPYLDGLRTSKGAYEFSAQYLNNPIDESAADFKRSQVIYYDPTTPHPSQLLLCVDPGLSLSRDADPSALVVAGQFANRKIRVVDYVHKRVQPDDLIKEVFGLVEKWNLHRVGIETFAFQKSLKYAIQNEQRRRSKFFTILELGTKRGGREPILSKEARIRRLQPYFEQGLVEIRRDMVELENELLAFPRGRHDDLIDALAYHLDFLYPSQNTDRREEPTEIVVKPPTWRDVARATWNKNASGGSLLARYMDDLRSRPNEPLMR